MSSRSRSEILDDALEHLERTLECAERDLGDQLVIDAICMRLSAGIEALAALDREYREELAAAMQRGAEAARPDLDAASVAALATACTAHVVAAMTLVRVDSDGACELLDNALALLGASAPSAAAAAVSPERADG